MKNKLITTLAVIAVSVSAASAAFAQNTDTLDTDIRGNDGGFGIDLRHSDDVELLSYGDDNALDFRADDSRDLTLWMLGDGVTGTVRSQGSTGLRLVMGMCPDGMHNETTRTDRNTNGLIIPRCVY